MELIAVERGLVGKSDILTRFVAAACGEKRLSACGNVAGEFIGKSRVDGTHILPSRLKSNIGGGHGERIAYTLTVVSPTNEYCIILGGSGEAVYLFVSLVILRGNSAAAVAVKADGEGGGFVLCIEGQIADSLLGHCCAVKLLPTGEDIAFLGGSGIGSLGGVAVVEQHGLNDAAVSEYAAVGIKGVGIGHGRELCGERKILGADP